MFFGDFALSTLGGPTLSEDIAAGYPPLTNETIPQCSSYSETARTCTRQGKLSCSGSQVCKVLRRSIRVYRWSTQSSSSLSVLHNATILQYRLCHTRPCIREHHWLHVGGCLYRPVPQQTRHAFHHSGVSWLRCGCSHP